MKNSYRILSFILFTCFCAASFAQKPEQCGTDKLIQRFLKSDPQGATKMRQTRDEIRGYVSRSVSRSDSSDTIITVPVVVHIIHSGERLDSGANISVAQIQSQINVLNLCFNKQNEDTALVPPWYQHLIANPEIRFCFAMYDTLGDSATGITRDSFAQGTDMEGIIKPATYWDPTKYLNIWVASLNGSANAGGDVLGYAYIPGMIPYPYDDGIVVDYHVFGAVPYNPFVHLASKDTNVFNLGKTAVHEVGHWLGLYHPFYGGCAGMTPASCDTAGDFICDTPPEAEPGSGNPNDIQVSCFDSTYYMCVWHGDTIIPAYDMWMTYMDYTNDDGLLMFTPDQAAEMRGVLNTVRLSIQYSTGSGNCKDSIDTITSLLSISPELNLSVYPNPSTGLITLAYVLPEKGEATILNTLGQSLFNRELTEVGQNARAGFDLSAYPGGLYFIKVQTQHSQKTLKFTLLR